MATGLYSKGIYKKEHLGTVSYWTTRTHSTTNDTYIGNQVVKRHTTITHTPVQVSYENYRFSCMCKKCLNRWTHEGSLEENSWSSFDRLLCRIDARFKIAKEFI